MGLKDFFKNARDTVSILKNADLVAEGKFKPLYEEFENIFNDLKNRRVNIHQVQNYCQRANSLAIRMLEIYAGTITEFSKNGCSNCYIINK